MADTTVKKVDSSQSPKGDMGQKYLAAGTHAALRMWDAEPPNASAGKTMHTREYETVGYVISGKATLHTEGQTVTLAAGDSWAVPAGASHRYEIEEAFTAVEATSPPARAEGRDQPTS